MEYSRVYDINRKMHLGPCCELVKSMLELHEKYTECEIIAEDPLTKICSTCKSVLNLLGGRVFHMGGKARVIAKGEYPLEILKECVESIGGIFSYKDTSRTTQEIMYKHIYGHYPYEELAQE